MGVFAPSTIFFPTHVLKYSLPFTQEPNSERLKFNHLIYIPRKGQNMFLKPAFKMTGTEGGAPKHIHLQALYARSIKSN